MNDDPGSNARDQQLQSPPAPGVTKSKLGLGVSVSLFAGWLVYLVYMAIRLGQ